VIRQERTVCDPNCHAAPKCGLNATVEDERIVAVEPADYPIPGYENRICLMGRSRLEYQYHPDRLRTPLKRVGERGENQWEAISWDEAIDLFVQNHRRIAERYGPRSVALTQLSGAFGLLTRGTLTRYAALTGATVQQTSGVDFALAKGLEYMFGEPATGYFRLGGHDMADAVNSELTILWGSNMAVTRSVDHAPLKAARTNGTRLICIDPTRSETAGFCDEWISIRPGTDGALALALANHIIAKDLIDRNFLLQHTDMPFLVNTSTGELLREKHLVDGGSDSCMVWCRKADAIRTSEAAAEPQLDWAGKLSVPNGEISADTVFSQYSKMARQYTPQAAAKITGIPEQTITHLAEAYVGARPAAIRMGFGIDRYYHSDSTARAIASLACLTGNIGMPGAGISINAAWKWAPVRARTFYAPDGRLPAALTMMDVDTAVRKGEPYPIKMECIALSNAFNQLRPNRAQVLEEYVSSLEFIAVIDHFMTDTAKQADLVLPACTIFERTDLIVDNFLQLQQRIVEPEGDAKSDFEIFCLLGEKMGFGDYFNKTAEEYLAEILDYSASKEPQLEDVTFERLAREKVIYPWESNEPHYGFKDKVFKTASGRIEHYKEQFLDHGSELPYYREPVEASPDNPDFDQYPLVLLSAHSKYRIHSTFANMEMTRSREPEPVVRISPEDADHRHLTDGDIVSVYNKRGLMKIKCKIDDRIRPGTVLVREGHWAEQFIEGDPYILTHNEYSETAQNYAHYDVLVEVCAADRGTAA
jgi:molybdopterin-containing oxidoreductase family molybdopterin binding subunit